MKLAEAKKVMKQNGWYTQRSAYKNWAWVVQRLDRCALGGQQIIDCVSNGFDTQGEAVEHAVEQGFEPSNMFD